MKRMNKTKTILALALVALLLTCAVGGTVAYLVTKTDAVTNTFTPGRVTVRVEDTVSGNVKKDVKITNTGNTSAYIRVAIVANWIDQSGNIVAPWDPSDEEQGSFVGLPGTGWKNENGYYYYNDPVPAGQQVPSKIFESYTIKKIPDGAVQLKMTIIAQGIQSEPSSVVQTVWNWTPTVQGQ